LRRRTVWLALPLLIGLSALFAGSRLFIARAQEKSSMRKTTISVDTTMFEWCW